MVLVISASLFSIQTSVTVHKLHFCYSHHLFLEILLLIDTEFIQFGHVLSKKLLLWKLSIIIHYSVQLAKSHCALRN